MIPRTHLLVARAAALSLVAAITVTPAGSVRVSRPPAGPPSGTADCLPVPTCYTPRQLEVAYGVQPLLQRGIDGRGETVVLPELAEAQLSPPQVTDLRQDVAAFDRVFHLPAPRLRVVSTFAGPKTPWLAYGEEVLDAEVVHTIAPRAALTVVLVKGTSLDSPAQAVAASVAALRRGAAAGSIISLSPAGQIGGEHCVDHAQLTQLTAALQAAADHHVTVVAATGDSGAAGEPCALSDALSGRMSRSFTPHKEVILVASEPLVLSVGGTTLAARQTSGAWVGETCLGRKGRPREKGAHIMHYAIFKSLGGAWRAAVSSTDRRTGQSSSPHSAAPRLCRRCPCCPGTVLRSACGPRRRDA